MESNTANKKINVFYSWQSDLPRRTNQDVIRYALEQTRSELEGEFLSKEIKIYIDEATRNVPGSPNIPQTIMDKIRSSDIFVADITTVNKGVDGDPKTTPNPNVLFELGYAVACLGWNRVIMLFNKSFGNFPNDTPFDIDRHRVLPYTLTESNAGKKGAPPFNELLSLIKPSLKHIIENPMQKPGEILSSSPAEIIRKRDMESLKKVFSAWDLDHIDNFLFELPRILDFSIDYYRNDFQSVVCGSLFHLYDSELLDAIADINWQWTIIFQFPQHYRTLNRSERLIFSNPGDAPLSQEQQKDWDTIEASKSLFRGSLDRLLEITREKFIEIDIIELSRSARIGYIKHNKEMEALLSISED